MTTTQTTSMTATRIAGSIYEVTYHGRSGTDRMTWSGVKRDNHDGATVTIADPTYREQDGTYAPRTL